MSRGSSRSHRVRHRGGRWLEPARVAPGLPRRWLPRLLTRRVLLVGLGAMAGGALLLVGTVLYLGLSGLEADRAAALAERLGWVGGAIDEAQQALAARAHAVAQDDATVSALFPDAAGGPGRGASDPASMLADRVADLLLVLDTARRPILRVPSGLAVRDVQLPGMLGAGAVVGVIDQQPYLLGVAFVLPPASARVPAGTAPVVLVGRRLDALSAPLVAASPRADIAVTDGDDLVWSTRAELPPRGWRERSEGAGPQGQRLVLPDQEYGLYPLTRVGGRRVWALIPHPRPGAAGTPALPRAHDPLAAVGLLGFATLWTRFRREWWRGGPGAPGAAPSGGTGLRTPGRNRELEVLNAIAVSIGRSTDLVAIAGETLDMLRSLTRVDLGAVYRLDSDGGRLVLVAQRGVGAEDEDRIRIRPVAGTGVGRTVRTGRATVTRLNQVSLADPSVRALAAERGHRTQVALPIMTAGEPWGVMALVSQEHRDFGRDEIRLLETVAHQVGVAVERMALLETAAARLRRLEALREIESHISEQLDLERVLEVVASSVLRLIGGARALVWLREGNVLRPRAWRGMEDWLRETVLPVGEGVVGQAAAEGRGLLVNDYRASGMALPRFEQLHARVLAQPLTAGGQVLGVLTVNRDAGAPEFTPDDLATLAEFAAPAAIAIGNARLFEAARGYSVRLRALQEVNLAVSASLDLGAVLDTLTGTAAGFFRAEVAAVWVSDEGGQWLVRRSLAGDREAAADLIDRLAWGQGMIGWIAVHQMPVMAAHVGADEGAGYREWALRHGLVAFTGLPLAAGGRLLGVLTLNRRSADALSSEEVAMLHAMAAQATIAIDNARLYSLEQSRRGQIEALSEITRELALELDPDRLLPLIVEHAGSFFRGEGTIFLLGPDGLAPAARRGPEVLTGPVPVGHGISGRTAALRQGLLVNEYAQDAGALPEVVGRGVRRVMAQPLVAGGRLLGVIAMYRRGPDAAPFSPEDLEVLERFAAPAAVALQNARLYREAREYAERLLALEEVNRLVSSSLDATEVLRNLAAAAARFFEAPYVTVWVMEPGGDRLRRVVERGGGDFSRDLAGEVAVGDGAVGWVAQHRASILWADLAEDVRAARREVFLARGLRFLSCHPIVLGDRVLGALTVHRATPLPATPETTSLLGSLAAQAGVALDHARLFEELGVRATRLRTLTRLNQIISSPLDIDSVLAAIARAAAELISTPFVSVWVMDEAGTTARLRAASDEEVGRDLSFDRVAVGEGSVGWVAAERRPLDVPDVFADPRFPAREWWQAHGLRSYFAVPILHEHQLLGVLALCGRVPFRLGADDRELLESFVAQAAVAIRNAHLYAETRRRVEELSALHELSRAVTGQLDEAGVIEAAVQQVERVLDARHLVILLATEGGEVAVAVRVEAGRRVAGGAPRAVAPERIGLGRVVLETRRPVRTDEYLAACRRHGVEPAPDSADLPYWMGVPMLVGARTLGALVLRGRGRPFSEGEERLLVNIADLAALALRSAQLFAERTKAYEELAAAQDQLVRSEKLRALGEMASGVAHDFNNVLAAIVGRAQLLLRHVEEPRLRRWLEVIERSALDGAHTVRRLQEFTRIRRDQPFVPVDLNQVVQDALEATESRWGAEAQRRGVEVRVETALDSQGPHVSGDPAELREALVNLILNAVDAMPEGGVLTLGTAARTDRVELAVTDTGVGIPADVRGKIFDPFFTTKGPQGTGLGLSMTYGILTRHGARVAVESGPGRGTTFLLTFPLSAAGAPRPPASAPPEATQSPAPPLRCLVVDDEVYVGEMLGDLLTSAGHRAEVFTDAKQAVARFGREPFDVVFTDLSMPGLSGWQVARAVKSRAPEVPVFLVTGFGAEVSPDDLGARGVDAVLAKPLRLSDLLGALVGVGPRPGDQELA